jgi:hypothetical protein
MDIKIEGTKPLIYRLERIYENVNGPEVISTMRQIVTMVLRRLRIKAPVDRGHLRAGTVMGVSSRQGSVQGIVGVPATYSLYQEKGTVPHFPPLSALEGWAKRHGTTAYIVCRAIARRGNIALWYARDTKEELKNRIYAMLDDTIRRMVEE